MMAPDGASRVRALPLEGGVSGLGTARRPLIATYLLRYGQFFLVQAA